MNSELATFVDKLLEEKGATLLEPEIVDELKRDLIDRVETLINMTLLEKLPPEKLEDFNTVIDGGNQDEITKFCEENIPNLTVVIANALVDFRNSYLGIK